MRAENWKGPATVANQEMHRAAAGGTHPRPARHTTVKN